GTVRMAVAEPRTEGVRGHWEIALGVVERSADSDGVVGPSLHAQGSGDLGRGDWLPAVGVSLTEADRRADPLGQHLVNQVPRVRRRPEADRAPVATIGEPGIAA